MKTRIFKLIAFSLILSGCFSSCVKEDTIKDEEINVITRAADFAVTDYYWYKGEKIFLQKMDEKSHVMFYSADEERFKGELTRTGIKLQYEEEWKEFYSYSCDLTGFGVKKFTDYKTATIEGRYEKATETLSSVLYWAPYYKTEDGGEIGITNLFLVLLKPKTDLAKLEELAKENSVEMLGADKDIPGWYYLACTNGSKGNSLEMANLFYETGLFEESNADFIIKAEFDCINEPWFTNGYLWNLNNISYPDIDVDYCNARAIVSQASSSITVAIIDEGVQTNHSDLYNLLPGWDAHTGNSPNYVDGSHGTMVAGFIGAIPNNGVGVAGIAYGAKILPISLRLEANGIISSGIRYREAFNHAVNNGARVISCSWWYPYGNDSNLEAGIINALNQNRVVVFSSGNQYNSSVNYPKAIDPRLLVVGAISPNGNRASFSNYGAVLDVVAPGENLRSTTISNTHVTGINGTSLAAPQVAGIAALILSANPSLTQEQVSDIIESTTQKVGSYSYATTSGRFNGTWNNQMGYGLVDAFGAVNKAYLNNASLNGNTTLFQHISTSYSISNIPPGVTFNDWVITPSTYTASGTTSTNLNITFNNPGLYTITARFRMSNNTIAEIFPKSVYVLDTTPVIGANVTSWNEGAPIKFWVVNSIPGGSYQWKVNGVQVTNNSSSELNTVVTYGRDDRMVIDCRVSVNGVWSNWSSPFML
ncbi:MAG: S8 family serine peptidase [Tannerellaceae bacterium]|jgi:hypothetical protein|nr:S8 family serine peptidase [Tannerellaceae bacterium]